LIPSLRQPERPGPPRAAGRAARLWIVAAACGLAAALPLRAGGNGEQICSVQPFPPASCTEGQIVDVAWSPLAQPVRWWMNQNGVRGNTEHGGLYLDPTAALSELQAAGAVWESLAESSISFRSMGTTTASTRGLDNMNLIYWSDTELSVNTLAVTTFTALPYDLVVSSSTRDLNFDGREDLDRTLYPDGVRLRAGTIIDADITFNSSGFDWSLVPDSRVDICDIRAVAMHELGHVHGLSHSLALREPASMFAYFDTTSAAQQQAARSLEWDDVAASARIYPVAGAGPTGVLSGRVVRSNGDGVVGAQVSAIDVATGREVESVFTSSALRVDSGGVAGKYRLDRLPPGTYQVAIDYLRHAGQSNTGWRWLDDTRTVYNLTVDRANLDPGLVAPSLLTVAEGPADDLLPPYAVALAAGQQVTLPDLVANESYPAPPAGSVQLHSRDNLITSGIPTNFPFPFFGRSFTEFSAYDNGFLTFGPDLDRDYTNYESGGNFFQFPRIAGLLRDLNPDADGLATGGPDIYVVVAPSWVETTWLSIPEKIPPTETSSTSPTASGANTFTIGFDATGRIWIDYQRLASPFGIAGVAAGDGITGVAEKYDFGRPRPLFPSRPTLEAAARLSGLHLDFTPHALGGYVVSSPQWRAPEVAPAATVGWLRAEGGATTRLTWPAAEALRYHVYRSRVESLQATGAYTDAGSCFTSSAGTEATDTGDPGPAHAYFYLVTATREFAIEGSLGRDSRGGERANAVPCRVQ
jgi:hypothetical protein